MAGIRIGGDDDTGFSLDFGEGSQEETARWNSMLQSLRRQNETRQHQSLAEQVNGLAEENARLRFCLTSILDLLVEKRVVYPQDVEFLWEAVRPPQAVQTQ